MGKTKRGKGTKIMAVTGGAGVFVAARTAIAGSHEIALAEDTIGQCDTGSVYSYFALKVFLR